MRKELGLVPLWLLAAAKAATGFDLTFASSTAVDHLEIAPGGSQGLEMTLIPEPTTAILLGLGLLGLALAGRKRSSGATSARASRNDR
jgi:hypothetical protein